MLNRKLTKFCKTHQVRERLLYRHPRMTASLPASFRRRFQIRAGTRPLKDIVPRLELLGFNLNRFADTAVDRIPNHRSYDVNAYSERSSFGGLVDILHPYSVMRLLAEGKANKNASVIWQYGPLFNAVWATEQELVPGAQRTETFLIATEG
jgi:hypothetical protein